MRLKFISKAKWSKEDKNAAKAATRWACKELDLVGLPIDIVVRFVGPSEYYGGCSQVDETRYIVWLHAGVKPFRVLATIFHELTHVHQHVYQEFELITETTGRFRGIEYTNTNYWNAPWEVEARRQERKLLRKYRRCFRKLK